MSELYLRKKSLTLAQQVFPHLSGDDLNKSADHILTYIQSDHYQNFIGLQMVADDVLIFSEMINHVTDQNKVPERLVLRDYQRDLLSKWQTGEDTVVLHSRHMGISLCLSIYALWLASFQNKVNLAYIVSNHTSVQATTRRIMQLYYAYGGFELPEITKSNTNKLEFANGNQIFVVKNSTYVMGASMSHVLTEDTASCSLADEDNLYSTIMFANRGQTIMTGTPYRNLGMFYEVAETNSLFNNVQRIELPYSLNPSFDSAWETKQKASMSPETFENQFNCKYIDVRS